MDAEYEERLNARVSQKLTEVPQDRLMNLYYTYFVTCNAFSQLAAVVPDEILRSFVLQSFWKEFTLVSLREMLRENGLWEQ